MRRAIVREVGNGVTTRVDVGHAEPMRNGELLLQLDAGGPIGGGRLVIEAARHGDGMFVVGGLAVDAAGRVLMARRGPNKLRPGMWEYPGGKIDLVAGPGSSEYRESDAAALAREWREELSVPIKIGRWIDEVSFTAEVPITWRLYHVVIDCEIPGRGKWNLPDHDGIDWFGPLEAIKHLPCTPTTYLCFRRVQWFVRDCLKLGGGA